MTKPISELTYKIVAYPEIKEVDTNESIDWAIEMMELGYESPSLYMLASFDKPTNYYEIIDYVKDAVNELGLEMKNGEDAILSYASYYIHQIAKGQRIRENLSLLCNIGQMRNYDSLVSDFKLLNWAWDDIDYDDTAFNHYWEGANKDNIEKIVVEESIKWIEKYKNRYTQSSI